MTQNGPVDGGLWIFKAETKKKKRETEDLSSKYGKQISVEKDCGTYSEDETKEEGLLFEEDYHDSMNAKNFEKYFASLCEKLPKNSVVVIDNASYNSRNSDSYPKSNWRKQQLIDWLKEQNVTISDKTLRAKLWTMDKVEREKYSSKVVDEIATRAGHTVILKAETKKKKRETEDLSSKYGKQISVEKDCGTYSEDETKEEGLLFEEDYHDSMNAKNFEKYFASLCEKLPKNSVVVIDNASYNSRNSDSYPKSNWRKQQLIDWLKEQNVTISDKTLRAKLWTMDKVEREKYSSKVVDEIATRAGHTVIRLPPYHCELNPLELAWAAEKNFVAKENSEMKLDSIQKLFRKKKKRSSS